jgi:Flp pilus assembly protein TadD
MRASERDEAARRAFEVLPDAPVTLYWMHVVALAAGDLDQARARLQQAIAIHPRFVLGYVALGSLCWMRGETEPAARAFAVADAIGASWDGVAIGMWAQFQLATGRGQPNLAQLEAQALAMPYSRLPYHLGRIYLALRPDPARAVRFLRIASDCAPDEPETHELYGNALIAAQQFDSAAQAFRRAVELCPALGSSWDGLGFALRQTRDFAGAEAAYVEAVRLAPKNASARRGFGATLLERGQAARAVDELRAATELEPESGGAHYLLALALERAGRRDQALASAFRARGILTDDADVTALVKRLQGA